MIGKLSYSSLVDHVALASTKVHDLLLADPHFSRSAVFLGRDATPVQRGVEYLAERYGSALRIAGFDISTKFLCENWERYEPASNGKGHFITRLNHDEITADEMRRSLFFQYMQQERFLESGEITLVDNGINGTLLDRLNRMLHIAVPELKINNIMLYYSGSISLDNLTVVMDSSEEQLKALMPGNEETMQAYVRKRLVLDEKNAELECWPHPYPSASHFYPRDGRIHVGHEPNTGEELIDWIENFYLNERLLLKLKDILE
jgi:hypothetical protein